MVLSLYIDGYLYDVDRALYLYEVILTGTRRLWRGMTGLIFLGLDTVCGIPDGSQGVYVNVTYDGQSFGGSASTLYPAGGGSSEPNYDNNLYIEGMQDYDPWDYFQYYLDDASGSTDTLTDLTGIQGLYVLGDLYNPDGTSV